MNASPARVKRTLMENGLKAGFHCSRFARAGGAGFENLLPSPAQAKRTLMANGLNGSQKSSHFTPDFSPYNT
jgi:hypothetical protein